LFVNISQVIGYKDCLQNDLGYVWWGVKLVLLNSNSYPCRSYL